MRKSGFEWLGLPWPTFIDYSVTKESRDSLLDLERDENNI